jgi:protein ImuB
LHLRHRDRGVDRFEVVLEHDGHPPSTLAVGLRRPERSAETLFGLARLRLERSTLPAPVRGLRVEAAALPPFVPERRDLFEIPVGEGLDFGALRDRLCARLGPGALHGLQLQPDLRPERRQQAAPPGASHGPFPPRPTWLLPRPQPWPERDPMILAGPERIESGWWDGDDVRRDYYVVQSRHGQRAWVFCAPGQQGPYWLQGWFA